MSQETENIDYLKKRRSVFRRNATRIVNTIENLKNGDDELDVRRLKKYADQLREQQNDLRGWDKQILEYMLAKESEEACDIELKDASEYDDKITDALIYVEEELEKEDEVMSVRSVSIARTVSNESIASCGSVNSKASDVASENSESGKRKVRIKLPQLEIKKFAGKVHEFREFWDSFSSAIHENRDLADVDKLKYLKGFLEEPARSVIGGLPMTGSNYVIAVDLLKKRFDKPSVIQHAHINQLINLPPIFNENDVGRIRGFRDQIEAHFRGLEAMSVDKLTYSKIVVPVLMEKLPKSIRFSMVRAAGKSSLEWSVEELLKGLDLELEVRECHTPLLKNGSGNNTGTGGSNESRRPRQDRAAGGGSASALYTPGRNEKKCVFCEEEHLPEDCSKYKDPEERKGLLRKFFKCFVCLKAGHRSFECRSRFKCKICKAKHHVAICNNKPVAQQGSEQLQQASTLDPSAPTWVGSTCSGDEVALQTALAYVNDKREQKVRVLFDSGSQRSFISAKAVETLGLRPVRRENLEINAFGSRAPDDKERDVVEIFLHSIKGKKNVKISCFVVDNIADVSNVHVEHVKKLYPHLHMIWFSDVSRSDEMLSIHILVGADYQWEFLEGEEKRGGPREPVAVKTTLGWVLSGPLKGETIHSSSSVNVNFVAANANANQAMTIEGQVHKLWDLDSLGIRQEDEVQELLVDNISFNSDRYSVGLPWKAGHGPLPLNYNSCIARLKNQIRKFKQDPETFKKYDSIISEQVEMGIISRVLDMDQAEKISYLPHSAVVREDAETTKVRVVYDASCRDKKTKTSLNDCLHVGPSLTPLIFDILLRFRNMKVGLVGDITKAFLNIEVDPADRDCLRFLWVDDIDAEEPQVVVYRFNRVVFGVNSSPFLLNAVLRHHLLTFQESDPDFVSLMSKSFYVDDLVTGANSTDEAYDLYSKARDRMLKGGFELRKWKTNDESLRKRIYNDESKSPNPASPSTEEESYAKETLGTVPKTGRKTKVLGIGWDFKSDTLEFDLTKVGRGTQTEKSTKRGILSTLATLFDPLGLTSPVGVHAKILFQELCVEKLDWDDPIPESKISRWEEWITDLNEVKSVSVPRCVYDEGEGKILSCELHGFGDASKRAYCAVIYLVCRTTKGIYSKLICAKTRVAPIKDLSIPRLELMSARILAVLMDNVKKSLSPLVSIKRVKYWLDSKTALYWIYNQGQWKQWVQFRVAEILKLSKKEDWGHVGGTDNPADIGSRGVMASALNSSKLWWEGPVWLRKEECEWPQGLILSDSDEIRDERKKAVAVNVVTEACMGVGHVISIGRYSKVGRLFRVTSWVLRFVSNLKKKVEKRELRLGGLEVDEIEAAELLWIKDAQKMLKKSADYDKTRIQLGIIEKGGVLVCQGRLENSDLDINSKYPIILPKDHQLAQLIVLDCHEKVHHSKVRATLAEVRSRFWITRGRQFVKRILKPCFRCRLLEGRSFNAPATAALPDFRVTEAPPFSSTGIDFAGPLLVKESNGEMVKTYIAVFSCCITRAIHLELVSNLSSSNFLNCLRRFCARRGTPRLIVSDNAKTFKSTCKMLNNLLCEESVEDFLITRRITWRFNLERSPWWGGLFERMVGSVKRCLRKVLGNARLSQDEMSTVLIEVESTLNSRPLTYYHEEFDEQVLTPSHLLVGRRISPLSDNVNVDLELDDYVNDSNLSKRFLYLTKKLKHFWNRWHKEYLSSLREVHRMQDAKPNVIAKGDIVLVYEDNVKRNTWKIGIVEDLIKGRDGEIRGAKVRKSSKGKIDILNRPLQKLFPLEYGRKSIGREGKDGEESKVEEVDANAVRNVNENTGRERPRRAAALDARLRTQLMLES